MYNNLRCVQRDPDHPEAHLHTPGEIQEPPFAQSGVQTAEERRRNHVVFIWHCCNNNNIHVQ